MVTVKELAQMELNLPRKLDLLGHSACAGCGLTVSHRMAMLALGKDTVQVTPACCTSIVQSPYPKASFGIPVLNIAFAAAASAASGVSSALQKQGRENITTLAWAGDGGTTDIGLAALSGAAERNENMIYVCYDNEIYGNTGNQRSSATPPGAKTTTTPTGNLGKGKFVPFIMMAHDIPYIATANSGYPRDIYDKIKKASQYKGFKYIHILIGCPTNWNSPVEKNSTITKLGVETGFWPMFEVEHGKVTLTRRFAKYQDSKNRKPLDEFLKPQGRFKNMTDEQLKLLNEMIDERWGYLNRFID